MIVDTTKPWEESQEKKPKIGEVIKSILAIQSSDSARKTSIEGNLVEVETDVTARLELYYNNVDNAIDAHTSKLGPAHGETKATIGLGLKENLPAASLDDIENGIYKREWCTPQILSYLLSENLKINIDEYMVSGILPLSSGRLLGRVLTNQTTYFENAISTTPTSSGPVSYLFSTEEGQLMFAEYGDGRVTDFSGNIERAPIGTSIIDVRNGHVYITKGQPVSLNDLTSTSKFVKTATGLAWGFGEYNGNFYDSNFHETVVVAESNDEDEAIQEVEASLFDPTMVYKPKGDFYARNFNTLKHNFNELSFQKDGNYPLNNCTFLSSDAFISHLANTQLIQQEGHWGIQFDFVSGGVGITDWLPDEIARATDKVLSKKATYVARSTYNDGVSGFTSPIVYNTLSSDLPWGYENRNNFDNSNFASGAVYVTVFIPINDLIDGFDALSETDQQKFIDAVDTDLLVRISSAWDNELAKTGVLRIPFYYEVPDTTKAWCFYLDMRFEVTVGVNSNTVGFHALNWDNTKKPTITASLDLTNTDGTRFKEWAQTTKETPLHPKVFKGCFLETGGHITSYIGGQRQYVCYYQHNITSVKSWILDDLTPVLSAGEIIVPTNMFPANRFYASNTRILPLMFNGSDVTYLTRARDRFGKQRYGTFTINQDTFDLLSTNRTTNSSEISWLDKKVYADIPILIDNSNLRSTGVNTTAMVFSEANGFIGYRNHGFDGNKFSPTGPTEIDTTLHTRILLGCGIQDPYPIFFYFNEQLHWSVVSRSGSKNADGYDGCVGAIRVDLLYENDTYVIRDLPGFSPQYAWGNVFENYEKEAVKGLDSESFDDVFIVNRTGIDTTSYIFINYPELAGRYYSFEIINDGNGYYYPAAFAPTPIDMTEESKYGTASPYLFYNYYFTPFMLPTKFYLPGNAGVYALTGYDVNGTQQYRDCYMGWKDSHPLYVAGEHITVNGKSLLLDQSITLPIVGRNHHGGVFISYYNDVFEVYSSGDNPSNNPTEPNNQILFAGYWEKIGDDYLLSFHAPRGIDELESLDFINSCLPIIDGKQMALDSMGTTFPAMLGKLSGLPRQFYFKKS